MYGKIKNVPNHKPLVYSNTLISSDVTSKIRTTSPPDPGFFGTKSNTKNSFCRKLFIPFRSPARLRYRGSLTFWGSLWISHLSTRSRWSSHSGRPRPLCLCNTQFCRWWESASVRISSAFFPRAKWKIHENSKESRERLGPSYVSWFVTPPNYIPSGNLT